MWSKWLVLLSNKRDYEEENFGDQSQIPLSRQYYLSAVHICSFASFDTSVSHDLLCLLIQIDLPQDTGEYLYFQNTTISAIFG